LLEKWRETEERGMKKAVERELKRGVHLFLYMLGTARIHFKRNSSNG
jgi:hypothetical protein